MDASFPLIRIGRIVSGGQTGVDRAALDFALEFGIPCGGWCPNGRLAEDGPIDAKYPLEETPSSDYRQRTRWNVRDSDTTLILHTGPIEGGTLYTLHCAQRLGRPVYRLDLTRDCDPPDIPIDFLDTPKIALNIAGPRESSHPGIYNKVFDFLVQRQSPLLV